MQWTNHLIGGLNFYLQARKCFILQPSELYSQNAAKNTDSRKNNSESDAYHSATYKEQRPLLLSYMVLSMPTLSTCKISLQTTTTDLDHITDHLYNPTRLIATLSKTVISFLATILLRGTPRHLYIHIHLCFIKI